MKLREWLIIAIAGFIGFKLYITTGQHAEIGAELLKIKKEFKQLKDKNAQLAQEYKREKDLLVELQKSFDKEIKKKKEEIASLSNVIVRQKRVITKQKEHDLPNQGLSEIRFPNGPAIGYVQVSENGVVKVLYDHKFEVNLATFKNGNEVRTVANAFFTQVDKSQVNNEWQNKPYKLKITGGKTISNPIKKYKNGFFFNNKLAGQATQSLKDFGAGINWNGIAYGNPTNTKFRFLSPGIIERNGKIKPTLMIGEARLLPKLFKNTFIGVGVTTDSIFGGVSLEL